MDRTFLHKFLPVDSFDIVEQWLSAYPVHIRITLERVTKSGDYRSPSGFDDGIHKISINKNLNPFAFLITLTHEYAHLLTWMKFRRRAKPHGKEWNGVYNELLFSLIEKKIFPIDIEYALLEKIMDNGVYKTSANRELNKVLEKYNVSEDKRVFLDELATDNFFRIHNGHIFSKGQKMRTRFKCLCLNNRRWYYIDGMMRVIPEYENL